MATSGAPRPNADPLASAVRCGLGMIAVTGEVTTGWQVRVGVHSGQVIGGVLGRKKYQFDVWGRAVNIASRMSGFATPGTVAMIYAEWQQLGAEFAGRSARQLDRAHICQVTPIRHRRGHHVDAELLDRDPVRMGVRDCDDIEQRTFTCAIDARLYLNLVRLAHASLIVPFRLGIRAGRNGCDGNPPAYRKTSMSFAEFAILGESTIAVTQLLRSPPARSPLEASIGQVRPSSTQATHYPQPAQSQSVSHLARPLLNLKRNAIRAAHSVTGRVWQTY